MSWSARFSGNQLHSIPTKNLSMIIIRWCGYRRVKSKFHHETFSNLGVALTYLDLIGLMEPSERSSKDPYAPTTLRTVPKILLAHLKLSRVRCYSVFRFRFAVLSNEEQPHVTSTRKEERPGKPKRLTCRRVSHFILIIHISGKGLRSQTDPSFSRT